jgi:hypothetical protein
MPQGSARTEVVWLAERPDSPWWFLTRKAWERYVSHPLGGIAPPVHTDYTTVLSAAATFDGPVAVPSRIGRMVRFTATFQREEA